ncbi:MAG TPA: asparagine synthase (glutamine-hydrolyzing) [Tepidisphaeraceae bacterium]|nr:asparagine synthase (glutamine-hydrolyzing) [Tepidisphaeraceae bacterium]
MCGFLGIISSTPRLLPTPSTFAQMTSRISHRGPDGQGTYTDPHASLSHVRLAILDPDPRSNQPFQIGSHFLLFNGEIYNHPALRQELTQLDPSYSWRTTGDTETLLRAYQLWGESCLPKLNGMFAFAVYDSSNQSFFLARDPAGQKPLYYSLSPDHAAIAFASELSPLHLLPWPTSTLHQPSLTHYLSYGYIPSPLTIYQNIQKLPPAHSLTFHPNTPPAVTRYHDINTPSKPTDRDPWASTLRNLLTQSVQRQLISDVPLGCFLSGGIDSSILASCMTRLATNPQHVHTFSISFDDPRYDETPYARAVAAHLKTTHHEFRVTPDAAADLPALARVYGEPFADSSALPTHYLSRTTRQHVKVALSGDGGDELFAGYDRYRAMHLSSRLRPLSPLLNLLPSLSTHPKSLSSRLKRFTRSLSLPPADRYASYMRLFSPHDLTQLLLTPPDPAALNWLPSQYTHFHSTGRDLVESALATDRATYLPEDLFTKVDRASMLCALEVRSPFMDPDLLSFAAGLHTPNLLPQKHLLHQAFANDLPSQIFTRKKMGFALPIGQWFRTTLRPLLQDTLLSSASFASQHFHLPTLQNLLHRHQSQQQDHSQRLYALLMLELWWQSNK